MAANVVCLAILEHGQRKKLTLQTGLQEELLTALSSLTTITDSTLCTNPPQDTSTEVHCANVAATSSISGLEPIAGTSSSVIEAPVPLEDRHDYIHFIMPSFGPYEDVLSRGTPISGPVRRAIVDRLFQACYRLAWYPSRELYRTAAEGLVLKYPHLLDNVGGRASGLESWVLGRRNKFKNRRKKVENCPPEMMEKRAQSQHKRPRQPSSQAQNKKLCLLFDCSHLVVYGETAESVMSHNKWLNENAALAATDALRPRLLATAQERHERLRSLTISEALVLFPFLASEASFLLEFDIVFQKNIADDFAQECEQLCDIVLKHADDTEVAAFSNVATENPLLATFQFVAACCKESLSVVLSEAPCLFDIVADPCEYRNIAEEKPQIVEQLQARIKAFEQTAVSPATYPETKLRYLNHGGFWCHLER
ncbi:hypothetical protein HPB49_025974 [Dermacentor silvarum]|nr:hypothetical protein HPB49_025974 [Dermacentor silvarum]